MKNVLRLSLIICLVLLCSFLFACNKKVTFEDIDIIGENVSNLEEGNYTLRYRIDNLEEYRQRNDATVTVVVTDQNNNTVPLTSSRILKIEKDQEYFVTIMVSADNGNKTKTHNYTVKAIKSPIMVTFTSQYKNFDNIIKTVPYGSNLTDIPEVPDYTPEQVEGYTIIIESKSWDRNSFVNLKQNITVYAVYEISMPANLYTINYETYGGTPISPSKVYYDFYINAPQPPQKENCVFYGWYTDEQFQNKYSFGKMGAGDITLHAKWLEPLENATPNSYFNFSITSYDPNGYMISAKDKQNMPETVVIPNIYNGKPVIMLGSFSQCVQIKHLFVPETINYILDYAFSGSTTLGHITDMALETVTFAQTRELFSIQSNAFSYCKNLVSINIPDSVRNIESKAFYNCQSLTDIIFSENSQLQQIRQEAFAESISLETIIIPKGVNLLSEKAFFNCNALLEVQLFSENPPILQSKVFYNENDEKLNVTFFVLEDSFEAFSNHSVFSQYEIDIIQTV